MLCDLTYTRNVEAGLPEAERFQALEWGEGREVLATGCRPR